MHTTRAYDSTNVEQVCVVVGSPGCAAVSMPDETADRRRLKHARCDSTPMQTSLSQRAKEQSARLKRLMRRAQQQTMSKTALLHSSSLGG
eukprot:6214605-Pleurochrysis_carterae.AAC.1